MASDLPKVEAHVVYPHCRQVGPEDWKVHPRVMDVTPETTVQDIIDWHDVADKGERVLAFNLVVER